MPDPYQVLGLSKSAGPKDIKKASRRLAKKLHPEANKRDPNAVAKFAELMAAYELLGDEKKRRAFDRGQIDADDKSRFNVFEHLESAPETDAVQDVVDCEFIEIGDDLAAGRANTRPIGRANEGHGSYPGQTKQPQNWSKIALAGLAAVAAVYLIFFRSTAEAPNIPAVPGWSELSRCFHTTSFDGRKELVLLDDGTAALYGGSQGAPIDSGSWYFNEVSKRYVVTLSGGSTAYSTLRPERSDVCILIKGEVNSADLRDSWFSATLDDWPEPIPPEP